MRFDSHMSAKRSCAMHTLPGAAQHYLPLNGDGQVVFMDRRMR
jgi:hypothetical protein